MAKVVLEMNIDNAAFEEYPEVEIARIMQEAARKIENGGTNNFSHWLYDINGNKVGFIETRTNARGE